MPLGVGDVLAVWYVGCDACGAEVPCFFLDAEGLDGIEASMRVCCDDAIDNYEEFVQRVTETCDGDYHDIRRLRGD